MRYNVDELQHKATMRPSPTGGGGAITVEQDARCGLAGRVWPAALALAHALGPAGRGP